MGNELLIEIGLEELPAIPYLKELPNIAKKWENVLEEYALHSPFSFYSTPRRLIFVHADFALTQADKTVEFFGPPSAVAFKEGEATPAAHSFAKKCGVTLDDTTRTMKDGKEVLYYQTTEKGKESRVLLSLMVEKFLKSLAFGKAMRWAGYKEEFIRPIRWLNITLSQTLVEAELFGVKSSQITRVHRNVSFENRAVNSFSSLSHTLEEGKVIFDPARRRALIEEQFCLLEKERGFTIERDEALLDEVVTITEYPQVLLGTFDEAFLTLPPEVIITSMKTNQRYFPLFNDEKLAAGFAFVSNAPFGSACEISKGNEKVLRARLSDAMFFYTNDTAKPLSTEALKNVVYIDGLGSVYQKIERERAIGAILSEKVVGIDSAKLDTALSLAKADLSSEMVYEFTELQGIVGYYYALKQGEHADVAMAIREQYLPEGENSPVALSTMGAIVALSAKIDTLWGLFSIGKIPSGSKDPFALRRAALGVIRTVIAHDMSFNLEQLSHALKPLYGEFDAKMVTTFIKERITPLFSHVNPSIVNACLAENDLLELARKIEALAKITSQESFRENFVTFKRVANISKDVNLEGDLTVNSAIFENDAERSLYNAFNKIVLSYDYYTTLTELFGLKNALDKFFEDCMVNADDMAVRTNRKNLIGSIYKAILSIADIKDITL